MATVSPWLIWLVLRLDDINGIFMGGCFIGGIGVVGFMVARFIYVIDDDQEAKKISNYIGWIAIPVFVTSMLLAALVPTSKEAIAIWGLPKLANSVIMDKAQKVPEKAVDKLLRWLEEDKKEAKATGESSTPE
jgi:hypothetical protein